MAKEVFDDATILWGPHSFEDYANQVSISFSKDAPESTNFASGGDKEFEAGQSDTQASMEGFWDTTDPATKDADLFTGLANAPFTVFKTNPLAAGDLGYSVRGDRSSYKPGMGSVGDIAKIMAELFANQRALRVTCLATSASVSATGNGSGINLGNVAAGQSVYGVLQSNTSDTWPGTDRVTFIQETSATSRYQVLSTAGAITAPWWRAKWTYGGTGSFTNVRVLIAIE